MYLNKDLFLISYFYLLFASLIVENTDERHKEECVVAPFYR